MVSKSVDSQGTWKLVNPIVWTPELVKCLEASENKIAQVFDYWIDSILGGFIIVIKFLIDTSANYSEAKHRIFKGPRGKYMKSLKTWIKMLLCEKHVMPLN